MQCMSYRTTNTLKQQNGVWQGTSPSEQSGYDVTGMQPKGESLFLAYPAPEPLLLWQNVLCQTIMLQAVLFPLKMNLLKVGLCCAVL